MTRLVALVLGCLVAVYPLIVVFGLQLMPVHYLGVLFIALAILRLWLFHRNKRWQVLPLLFTVILILVAVYVLFSGQPMWFRYYPVAVNATLLCVFFISLFRGQPIVERLARLSEPDLPEEAKPYTRKVTILWCCFFVLNGLAALYTALYSSDEVWAWYNGVLSYGLMALLFAGEWLVRRRVQEKLNA